MVYEKLESSLEDLLFKNENLLSSEVFVSFIPLIVGDKLLANLSLLFGFSASSPMSSLEGMGGKSGGYGVSPLGLHVGQMGRNLSIEKVLTTARSIGGYNDVLWLLFGIIGTEAPRSCGPLLSMLL